MKDYNLEFKSMYSNVLKNMCKLYEENERRDKVSDRQKQSEKLLIGRYKQM